MPTVIKIKKANCLSTSKEPRTVSRLLRAVLRLLRNRQFAPLDYAHFQEEPVIIGVPS